MSKINEIYHNEPIRHIAVRRGYPLTEYLKIRIIKWKKKKGRPWMIANNNEEKRNQIWKAVMAVSTVLIIIIAAFFVVKLFTANPLEGRWSHEDSSLVMTVESNGTAVIEWPDEFDGADVSVEMDYSIDKDTKTFTLSVSDEELKKAAKASGKTVTAEELSSFVRTLEASYDYSIEQKELTLTEREYGNQMVFDKK